MKDKQFNYTVCLKYRRQKNYLLWQDGKNLVDKFILFPNSNQFLTARTLSALMELAREYNFKVVVKEPELLDVDAVLKLTREISTQKKISKTVCDKLLFAWNMFEDLERSCRVNITDQKFYTNEKLDKAYQKLFWGADILRPESEEAYHPVFSTQEVLLVKKFFQNIWTMVQSRTHQFY